VNRVKQHFEQEAQGFDDVIVKLIPYYRQMVDALVVAIPFETSAHINVIDLGCGTGTVAEGVLNVYPNSKVTCLDLAGNMISMARTRLARYSTVRFVTGDFSRFQFDKDCDAVVSSLALHHLATDDDKWRFYSQIYRSLRSGGCFYNADVVLASNESLQRKYLQQWREFMARSIPREEIESTWIAKYEAEDRPARLTDQLRWLGEIGFSDADVLWKYYNFAVYGGRKP
jgi:tRNA (cmo5U34)-methyltransferase